ncbi:MAG: hypothetical protein WCZ18_05765, partial [Ottowia sp.]
SAHSALQMLAMARAMPALCVLIGQILTILSSAINSFSSSERAAAASQPDGMLREKGIHWGSAARRHGQSQAVS